MSYRENVSRREEYPTDRFMWQAESAITHLRKSAADVPAYNAAVKALSLQAPTPGLRDWVLDHARAP